MRSRPKFAHAQYKNSAVQKIIAFHAGGGGGGGWDEKLPFNK